jgi:UPF0755 protein
VIPKTDETHTPKKFSVNEIYLVAAFFGFILGFLIITFFTPNYYSRTAPVELTVEEGSSLTEVIDSLCKYEVIPSRFNMKIAAFLYGAERKIKAGKYNIPNGLSYLQLVDLLVDGSPVAQKLVTIPEGVWQNKLAGILQRNLNVDSTEFMDLSYDQSFLRNLGIKSVSLEGYLLPDSYYFLSDISTKNIIRKLVNELNKFFDEEKKHRAHELGLTMHEVLTLASIIEAETSIASELQTVSGVYHNRLKRGMLLQADPTVQFLIRNRKRPIVLLKDLELNSPYNTYKRVGLPPSPINNPGKAAINAALYPEEHNYYYFVADGTGGHKFATTHSQHIQNVSEYRQWQREQRFKK